MISIAGAGPIAAAVCSVPSAAHGTIQAAVDDSGCTEIQLQAGTYAEAVVIPRSLTLRGDAGGGTLIEGQVLATAGQLEISDLDINGLGSTYSEALGSSGGAEVSALNVVVRNGMAESPLFADGFESADTSAWSTATP
jgi:nitrous oxidase accessory protein NosD